MNNNRKDIHKVLKNSLNLRFEIKAKSPSPEQIEKKLFIEALRTMVVSNIRNRYRYSSL